MSKEDVIATIKSAQLKFRDINIAMTFQLTEDQQDRLRAWALEQDKLIPADVLTRDGEFKYEFTPCSMGTRVVITHNITRNTIDLTEY